MLLHHRLVGVTLGGLVVLSACSSGSPSRVQVVTAPSPAGSSVPAASTPAPAPTAPTGDSGIAGRVTRWPSCPVETGDPACAPQPLPAQVSITRGAGEVVATARAAADGTFRVAVAPGSYVVEADAEGMLCAPVDVTVVAGAYAQVEVHCDSGVR